MTLHPRGSAQADPKIRELVRDLIFSLQPRTHQIIEKTCAAMSLEIPPDQRATPSGEIMNVTKAQRLQAGFEALDTSRYLELAHKFLNVDDLPRDLRYRAEELLWGFEQSPVINQRVRREIADALEQAAPIWADEEGLWNHLQELWILETATTAWTGQSLAKDIHQHFLRNDDWTVLDLFKQIGALDCGDRRFALLIEGLLSGSVNPHVEQQYSLVAAISPVFAAAGLKISETGTENGYPAFSILSARAHQRPPHLILFASRGRKPDLRLSEVLDGQIEVLDDDDVVLQYDLEVLKGGLTWQQLLRWWCDRKNLPRNSVEAKNALWNRLVASLPAPDVSPPQRFLFDEYHRLFGSGGDFPALLPEVWLHWDPKTKKDRGEATVMPALRMDFVMLLGGHRRVVLEVDGKQHYSVNDKPSPAEYAKTTRGDRELRLLGYEVYRFAGYELVGGRGEATVAEFFQRLFAV